MPYKKEKKMLVLKYLPDGIRLGSPETKAEFDALFQLRWEVLRKSWDLPRGSETDAEEQSSIHRYIALPENNQRIIACGRIQHLGDGLAQIRYMAVDPDFQGRSLGSIVLKSLENAAPDLGCNQIFLNAREPAVKFYLKSGYELAGEIEPFLGIRHFRMTKSDIQHISEHLDGRLR